MTVTLVAWLMVVWGVAILLAGAALVRLALERGDRFAALLGILVFSCGLLSVLLTSPAVGG